MLKTLEKGDCCHLYNILLEVPWNKSKLGLQFIASYYSLNSYKSMFYYGDNQPQMVLFTIGSIIIIITLSVDKKVNKAKF